MTTLLYALKTNGERRLLATRENTSPTFTAQCQDWTEKHGMPLSVIRLATERTPKMLKVFYPRQPGKFAAWSAARALTRERMLQEDDVVTVFEMEAWHATCLPASLPAALLLKNAADETTYPRAKLPTAAHPNCNCRAEVILYLRTFRNGSRHIYSDCSVCGKSTEGAIKRTLLPKSILQALLAKETSHAK